MVLQEGRKGEGREAQPPPSSSPSPPPAGSPDKAAACHQRPENSCLSWDNRCPGMAAEAPPILWPSCCTALEKEGGRFDPILALHLPPQRGSCCSLPLPSLPYVRQPPGCHLPRSVPHTATAAVTGTLNTHGLHTLCAVRVMHTQSQGCLLSHGTPSSAVPSPSVCLTRPVYTACHLPQSTQGRHPPLQILTHQD